MTNFIVIVLSVVFLCSAIAQKVTFSYNPHETVHVRYTEANQGHHKSSKPAIKNLPENFQGYGQQLEKRPHIATPDAIRIIDPPKFFEDQKRQHHSQYMQQNSPISPVSPIASVRPHNPIRYEIAAYSGPEYLPKPGKIPPKLQQQQKVHAHYALAIQKVQPHHGYMSIQTPKAEYLRPQIDGFRKKQKIYFQTAQDEHPVRTKYQLKPVTESEPIYGQNIYRPEEQKYRPGKDEYVVGNTFTVADNLGAKSLQSSVQPFVPYKMLASVRHQNKVSHQPRPSVDPRAKEHVRTQNAYTVYSEQGYADEQYDQGDEQRQTIQYHQQRAKREANFVIAPTEVDRVEELPIALSLVSNEGQKLAGQDLLKHIAGLIKNSKQFQMPTSQKTQSENLDSIILQRKELQELIKKMKKPTQPPQKQASNHQSQKIYLSVAGDPKNAPHAEKLQSYQTSPYQRAKPINCEFNSNPDFQQNDKKRKLGSTGQQVDCLKDKYFGKDPLGNKFFQDQYIPTQQSYQTNLNVKNPSLLVYKDVMQTIESSKNSHKYPAERSQYGLDNNPETALYPDAVLPIFDITKYFSQVYMIKPNGKVYGINFKSKPDVADIAQQYDELISESKQPATHVKHAATEVIHHEVQPRQQPQQYQDFSHQEQKQQYQQQQQQYQQPRLRYTEVVSQSTQPQYQETVYQDHQQARPLHYAEPPPQRPQQFQKIVHQEQQQPRPQYQGIVVHLEQPRPQYPVSQQQHPQSSPPPFQELLHQHMTQQQQFIQHPQTLQQTRGPPIKALRFHYQEGIRQVHQRPRSQ